MILISLYFSLNIKLCFFSEVKEEAEKVEKLENKYKMDIHTKEKQVCIISVNLNVYHFIWGNLLQCRALM